MTEEFQTQQIAEFAKDKTWKDIPLHVVEQLKKHLLDSIASFIHALPQPTLQKLLRQIKNLGEGGKCTVPVLGNVAADRAAQLYTALIRYPDFMDNFLGKKATCHPSDNIGPLLAASQLCGATGKDFLLAMAIGYEIECRLIEEVPVMENGFDHTTLLAISTTAALANLLLPTKEKTAHALGIAGCTFNPLVTCRASYTYEWKGFASSMVALGCMNIIFLADEEMTGPIHLFEGAKGFNEVHGMELKYDWSKDNFDLIPLCILKSYNSEVHTQSVLEAALELKQQHNFSATEIEEIDVTTFLTCYHIVGGGAYGDRTFVHSKEQADHSLPYVLAVALLDGEVYPEQLLPEKIVRDDVQDLLRKVKIHTAFPLHKPVELAGVLDPYTEAYPEKVPAKVEITLKNGSKFELKKEDYHGFHSHPLTWTDIEKKFIKLTSPVIDESTQKQIIQIIGDLENNKMEQLLSLLNNIKIEEQKL